MSEGCRVVYGVFKETSPNCITATLTPAECTDRSWDVVFYFEDGKLTSIKRIMIPHSSNPAFALSEWWRIGFLKPQKLELIEREFPWIYDEQKKAE